MNSEAWRVWKQTSSFKGHIFEVTTSNKGKGWGWLLRGSHYYTNTLSLDAQTYHLVRTRMHTPLVAQSASSELFEGCSNCIFSKSQYLVVKVAVVKHWLFPSCFLNHHIVSLYYCSLSLRHQSFLMFTLLRCSDLIYLEMLGSLAELK